MYGPTPCWRRNFTPSASPLIRLHNSASSRVRFLRNRRARSRRIQAFPSVLIPREFTIPWSEGIPLRPGGRAPGFLPRGTAVERGSTAEGREGARANRARSTTVSPSRPDGRAPGFLPRGTAVERGSTAEGREGARAKRARSTTVSPLRPGGRAPSALTGHSPTPLTATWGRNPELDFSPGSADLSPVERQRNGEYGR